MKFYQKHHWDGGKASLGFGLDWIKTLVSMATDSSHRVIMEKTVLPLFLSCFSSAILDQILSYLQVMMTHIRSWMSLKFGEIRSGTTELAALEHLKNGCCPFFSF